MARPPTKTKSRLMHFRADEGLSVALAAYAARKREAVSVVVREMLRDRLRVEGLLKEQG